MHNAARKPRDSRALGRNVTPYARAARWVMVEDRPVDERTSSIDEPIALELPTEHRPIPFEVVE